MFFKQLKTKAAHLLRGENAEQQAHRFLLKKGLKAVERNYRCAYGELDLIMLDGQTLVIVEVRYRQSNQYGSALESVTARKQQRIKVATQHYLLNKKINAPVRFDVLALSGDDNIDWVKNAF